MEFSTALTITQGQQAAVPNHWRPIGGPAHTIVTYGDRLAALSPDRQAVWAWNPADEQWTEIGGPSDVLVGHGWDLYAVSPNVWRWDGRAWSEVGGPGAQFVAIGAGLYGLSPSRDAVYRYDRYDNSWTEIGGPAASLVGGGSKLYAVSPKGDLWEYSRFQRRWTRIGGPGAQFVGVGGTVYGLTSNRDEVYRYDGVPDRWTRVGGPAERLIGGGSVLYAIGPGTGSTWRYSGSGDVWTEIGTAGAGQVAAGRTLYALTPGRDAVWCYDSVNAETRRLRTKLWTAYTDSAYEGRIRRGFLVKRLGGSIIAQHQAGAIFQPLSILKTLPHAHAAIQIANDAAALSDLISWQEDPRDDDKVCFGPDDEPRANSGQLRDVMPTSMWFSHNRSLEAMLRHFTVRAITENAQQLGLRETEMYLGCGDGTPGGWWAHNMSTLDDLARLFEGMESKAFTSFAGRDLFRHLMIERTPGTGTSYTSPILGATEGPKSSEFLRTIVANEAGSAKQGIVNEFMTHIVIRFKGGGGNPTGAREYGYGEFFQLDLPVKSGGVVEIRSYLLGWYLNQLHSPIVGGDSPELADFKSAMFREPIREALRTW